MINKERLLSTFLDYVQIDSESTHEGAMAARIAEDLQAIGCQIFVDDSAAKTGSETGNLYCTLPGNTGGEPILFAAHMDTVVPGGQIYVDSTLISEKVARTDVEVYYIPATQMANDAGVPTLANMVMMGHVLKNNPELSFDGTEATVAKLVPPSKAQLVELNMKALQAGKDYQP